MLHFLSRLLRVGQTHLGSEGGGGLPLARLGRRALLHHLIDLLQGQSLGLEHEEVGVEEAQGAQRAPDEEDASSQVALVAVNHVRGDNGDDLSNELAMSSMIRSTE